jgi:hypothetical protein
VQEPACRREIDLVLVWAVGPLGGDIILEHLQVMALPAANRSAKRYNFIGSVKSRFVIR